MYFFIWSVALIVAAVFFYRRLFVRFEQCGVKYSTPVTQIKTLVQIIFRKIHGVEAIEKPYFENRQERFIGGRDFSMLSVTVFDIELIKKIAVKDFEHFVNHIGSTSTDVDPLISRTLFSLAGEEWKDMRSTLSPAFTSSKIRLMVPFMVDVGNQMMEAIKCKIEASGDGYTDIDVEELTTRYANDVIASCAFGLKVDSHADDKNPFFERGKEINNFTLKKLFIFLAVMITPKLMKYLKLSIFPEDLKNFFRSLVTDTMRQREEQNVVRPDMIHLLMQAKKGNLSHDDKAAIEADAGFATVKESAIGLKQINRAWTDDDLVAQALVFFIAGFAPVSSTMSLILHELAVYPEVQEKLVKEIRENDKNNGGKFDYNSVQQMKYLDMVVSETMRLWPSVMILDRLCTKDYNLGKPNDMSTKDFILRAGEGLIVPVWAIHRDPEYFPDPLKFNPERFSEQNKHNIKPFTYMPFGLGPRNCIGSRFALCEVKVMVYQLLQKMEVSPAAKTQLSSKLSMETFNMQIEGGHCIRLRVRDQALRAGEGLIVPVWAIHRDPEYFPDPLKFDPERFSEQNKHNIKPFTYMPFRLGPRNCIGSRFALCEVKVMVYQLLQKMEVSPAAKTQLSSKLSMETFNMQIEGGHCIRLRVRDQA